MTENNSLKEDQVDDPRTAEIPVNAKILSSMQAAISPLPDTPKFLRKKPAKEVEEVGGEATESSDIDYPTRQVAKVPSFKRTAALLKKYPSLTRVGQMLSCGEHTVDANNDDGYNVIPEETSEKETSEHSAEFSIDASESSTWDAMEIEVFQGVTKRLRGSDETFQAFQRGLCVETVCMMCSVQLLCISDCDGVICPLCLSMSPLETRNGDSAANGTVGLGIQYEKTQDT